MHPKRLDRMPSRVCALLMALCCLFLSSFGSLLHTDELPFAVAANASTSAASASGSQSTLQQNRVRQNKAAPHHHHHCAVCDWQANLLSPALPILTIVPPSHRTLRVVTTLPRAPGTSPVFASSRAPPALS